MASFIACFVQWVIGGKIMKREKKEEQYEVHTALREDMNEGWVWIENKQ